MTNLGAVFKRAAYIIQNEGLPKFVRRMFDFVNIRCAKCVHAPIRMRWRNKRYGPSFPDRYQLLKINPSNIEYLVTPHFHRDVSHYETHVIGGDWETLYPERTLRLGPSHELYTKRGIIPLENFVFYTSAVDHFVDGVPWNETELYAFFEEIDGYDSYARYRTMDAVNQSLSEFDKLFQSIEQKGYRSQEDLRDEKPVFTANKSERPVTPSAPPAHDEIRVDIGREGEIYFDDGRHRFTAARIIGVSEIPVRVLVRHTEWQRRRQQVSRAGTRDELDAETIQSLSHPDMQDLLPIDD